VAARTEELEFTAAELVEAAHQAGFEVKPRLITDWESLGLLDSPRKRPLGRGRGSDKAVWPERQKDLFLSLLHHRSTVNRVAGLANIPVWVWLAYGDEWIRLRQARKALATWCGRHRSRPGLSHAEARRMSRQFAETVVQPHSRPADIAKLRRVVESSIEAMAFDRDSFRDTVRHVFDPHDEGRTIGPSGAPIHTDLVVRLVEARFAALRALDGLSDYHWESARLVYISTKVSYAGEQPTFAGDPLTGRFHEPPSFERDINGACIDLLTILGMSLLAPETHHGLAAEALEQLTMT